MVVSDMDLDDIYLLKAYLLYSISTLRQYLFVLFCFVVVGRDVAPGFIFHLQKKAQTMIPASKFLRPYFDLPPRRLSTATFLGRPVRAGGDKPEFERAEKISDL